MTHYRSFDLLGALSGAAPAERAPVSAGVPASRGRGTLPVARFIHPGGRLLAGLAIAKQQTSHPPSSVGDR